MKTIDIESSVDKEEELKDEYRFDYSKAKPNRFARDLSADTIMVVLEPDVAEVFSTSEDVNRVLRALIKTMPRRR